MPKMNQQPLQDPEECSISREESDKGHRVDVVGVDAEEDYDLKMVNRVYRY